MIPLTYNTRSLWVRRGTTAMTVLGVALVVFVFASTLMLAEGVERTLHAGGGDDLALVIRKGTDSELASIVENDKVGIVLSAPGVRKGVDGAPLGTGEVAMIVLLAPVGDPEGLSNVQVRGVDADVQRFRPSVRVVEGRMMEPGTDEAMVGRAIAGRFEGLVVGGAIEPKKNRPLTIVGVFADEGSPLESEVWAGLDTVRGAFGRQAMVSSVRVRLESPAAFDGFEAAIEGDRRLGLEAITEDDWRVRQSQSLSLFVTVLGTVISFFLGLGAMVGAMITMYSSIANRQREIGTLRALGFSPRQVLLSFLIESLILAAAGGLVGSAAALAMSRVEFSMLNFATYSEMVFTFRPSLGIFASTWVATSVMGLLGGLLPAVRAARMSPVLAMRH